MTAVTPIHVADPAAREWVRRVMDAYQQNGSAAAARELRLASESGQLTVDQKQQVYKGAENVVDRVAGELSQGAHGDMSRVQGQPGSVNPVDTKQEYDQTVRDLGVVFENTADKAEAREFAKDVLDGIEPPEGSDPGQMLGAFGTALKQGTTHDNTQFLTESVAFSLSDPSNRNGIFQLSAGSRKAVLTDLLGHVDNTRLADQSIVIQKGDTLWGIMSRKDVQARYFTPEELERAKTENWSADKRTQFALDKFYDGNPQFKRGLQNGRNDGVAGDPDVISANDVVKILNRSGVGLTVDTANTGGQTGPVMGPVLDRPGQVASAVVHAYDCGRNPGAASATYRRLTAGMSADQKAAVNEELLSNPAIQLNPQMLKTMGIQRDGVATRLAATDRDPRTGQLNRQTNLQALYKVYVEGGGDPSQFFDYVNRVAAEPGGMAKLDRLIWGAQGVVQKAGGGPLAAGTPGKDGAESHNWDGRPALADPKPIDPPGTMAGLRSMMDHFHIGGFPGAQGKA